MAIFRWPRHGLDSCWILAEYLIVDAFLLINPRCCILWIMSGFVWFQFLNSKSFCEICAFPQTALCEVQPLSWQAWALVSKTSLFPRKTSTKSIGWVLVPDFPGSQSEKESSLFYYLGPLSIHLHHRFCSQSTAAIVNCQFIFCSLQWTEDSPDEELQQHDSGPQPGWCWKWGPPQIHKSKELDLNPGDDKHLFVHKMDYTVSFIKKTSIRKSGFFSHWWMGFSWRKHVFIGCRWIPASWRHPRIYPQKGSWRDLHVVGGGWRCWCFASLSNHATGRRFFRISHQLTIGYHWFISYELGCPPSQFFVITRMTSDIFRLGDPKQPPTHLPGRGPTQHIMNKSKACWIPPRLRVQLLWLLWTFFGMSKRIGQLLKLKQKKHLTFAMLFFFTQVLMFFFVSLVFFSYELPLHVCCRLQSDSVHIDASHQSLCGKIVQCRQAQLWVECRFMGFTCLGSLCKFISSAERGAHGLHVKWRQPLFASMPRHCPACQKWILSLRCIILCILHHWMLY